MGGLIHRNVMWFQAHGLAKLKYSLGFTLIKICDVTCLMFVHSDCLKPLYLVDAGNQRGVGEHRRPRSSISNDIGYNTASSNPSNSNSGVDIPSFTFLDTESHGEFYEQSSSSKDSQK